MTGTTPRESAVSTPVSGVTPAVIAVDPAESRAPMTTPSGENAVDTDRKSPIPDDRTALDSL